MSIRRVRPLVVASALSAMAVWTAFVSAVGYGHAEWPESDQGLIKVSDDRLNSLVKHAAFDVDKAAELADPGAGAPAGTGWRHRDLAIARLLFADDAEVQAWSERRIARQGAVLSAACLLGSATIVWLWWGNRPRQSSP